MNDILTLTELAEMLKMSKGQIYEMTKERTRTGSMNQ
jgi:predicted DNA-binding transcriptional regulator AlpA